MRESSISILISGFVVTPSGVFPFHKHPHGRTANGFDADKKGRKGRLFVNNPKNADRDQTRSAARSNFVYLEIFLFGAFFTQWTN